MNNNNWYFQLCTCIKNGIKILRTFEQNYRNEITNSTFISKSKYYEIMNYLKQQKPDKKTNSKSMKKYDVLT